MKKKTAYSLLALPLMTSLAAFSLGSVLTSANTALAHPPPAHGSAHVSVHGGPGRSNPGGPDHHGGHTADPHHHGSSGPSPGGPPHSSHHSDMGGVVFGTITGMAIGAMISATAMPPSCTDTIVSGVSYRICGSDWYRPYYVGTALQYQRVNPPR